jgi:hypothetical protein
MIPNKKIKSDCFKCTQGPTPTPTRTPRPTITPSRTPKPTITPSRTNRLITPTPSSSYNIKIKSLNFIP